MKRGKLIILTLIIFLSTGCNYVELNKLAIVSALGIDYKNNEYLITAQVMDVTKSDSGSIKQSSLIYEAAGETIGKAVRNFSEKYPKTVYLGHLEIIILGKDVAEQKMNEIFDFILRSPEVRSTGNVLVNKEQTAKETLKPENEKENSFATEQIKSSLDNATKRTGTVNLVTFEEFAQGYLQKGIDPVVPLIRIDKQNDSKTSDTIIANLAVLNNNKIGKEMDERQSIAYNTINKNYYDVVITPKYKNKALGIILFNPKSKINTAIKHNKVHTTIDIVVEIKLNELNSNIDPDNEKINKELEKLVEKELKEYIESLINYCKESNSDVLGIGNDIYKNHYKQYNKYKNVNFYQSNIKVQIRTKLYRSGNTNKGAIK